MRDEDFEWDDAKARSNAAKHSITFETARLAFEDERWIEFDDPDPHEARFQGICTHDGMLYVVI